LIVGFLSLVAIGRVLGPADLGLWRTVTTIQALVVVVGDLGLTALGTREIAHRPALLPYWLGPLTALRVFGTSLVALMTLAIVAATSTLGNVEALLAVSLTGAVAGAVGAPFALQARERFTGLVAARLVGYVPPAIIGILLALAGADLIYVCAAWTVASIAQGGITAWLARRGSTGADPTVVPPRLRTILRRAMPFLVATLAIQIVLGFDGLILFATQGATTAGVYAAAYGLVAYAMLLGGALMTAAFPRLSRHRDQVDAGRFVRDLVSLLGAIGNAIGFVGIVLAPEIIAEIFGAGYGQPWLVVSLLFAVPLLGFFNLGLGQSLQALGREHAVMTIAIAAAAVNIAGNVILVPSAGMLGAAVAAVITEVATALLYGREASRSLGMVPVWEYLCTAPAAIAASAVAIALLLTLHLPAIVVAGVVVLVYAVLLIVVPSGARTSLSQIIGKGRLT
jgi:PST family polysaccharide transporter